MKRSFRLGAEGDGGLQVLWEDGERIFCRARDEADDGSCTAVLAVVPASEHPTPSCLDRLAHEYGLKDELDGVWAVRPLEFLRDGGRAMLVLEDPGGEPLDRLLGTPMELECFLRLAIGIATALSKVHERALVHKDIKPANILVNEATGEVRLTGFGIASRLSRERQAAEPPEALTGTLAYMAPEQTGRMNRSIDSRSDLYALGVTFYQMLTGALPFAAADPMEWVHCHLARRPVAPADRLKEVPGPVSAIIMKLLAKTAEDRYQTAAGLESDLRRCLTEWEAQRRIDDFPLGEHDTSDRLLIPEKLYGRRREVETLLASFNRIVNGSAPELVLISGYSGIGKSSVVNELHKSLVPPRGVFASGKFDQYKRDIPYATLAQAFQGLIRPLLSKSEEELSKWRDALHDALGPNGKLIVNLVPELQLIIGEPPPVLDLPLQDAQRRFQFVFRRFIGVFARPEHPLALFLDDLQWLDSATLDLIENLLTQSDVRHLMLIGAYRDNEVNSSHPLMRKLDAIRRAGALLQEIALAPLTREDLAQLISDALHCESERATALAELIHEKTVGNPFFAIQFISELVEEGLLTFDYGTGRWSWDVNSIRAKDYTDNVVDLMVGKLSRLPIETQQALQLLACMGNSAEFDLLEMVSQQSNEEMHRWLWEAIRAGLIFRTEHSYTFLHDRVQEAAYSLIPEEARAEAHLRIGRLLATHVAPEEREEAIFEIVNQLNRGAPLITSRDEREQLAELNLIAGKRAKASSAYASALTYLTAGAALLLEDGWARRQELAFALELHRADCELWTGALPSVEDRLAALAARAASTVQRAAVASRRVDLYTMLGASDRAIAVGLEYLRHVGIDWAAHPTELEARREYERIWSHLGSREIEDLINLPPMQDPASLATLDVLTTLGAPTLYTDENLYALTICRAVNLSLERGNSDAAPAHYVSVGLIAGYRFGDYDAGYRLGRIACDLTERRGLKRLGGKTYVVFAHLVPWTRPVREGIDPARRAFQMANEQGDATFAAYACRALASILLASGEPLDQVAREAEHGLEFSRTVRFGFAVDMIAAPLALIRTLRGETAKFGLLDHSSFTERSSEERLTGHPALALPECFYWIRKLQARFFAGDYASATDAAEKAERWFSMSSSLWIMLLESAEYHLYAALSRAACCEPTGPDPCAKHREALAAHGAQLRTWAANCPENFENCAALVSAEVARIEGRDSEAMRLYEQAIRSAHANGFIHNEAIAYEVAARFYAARGFDKIADAYFLEARYGYLRWGAEAKVRQLDQQYPQLRQEKRASSTSMIAAPVEHLDLATVMKVSQAVSGEMVPEKLIDRLMRAAIEHAGAERGLLIVPRGDDLQIEAEAITSGEDVTVHLRDAALTAAVLPESLVRYVVRTRETVLLDNASSQDPFSTDPYIVQRLARSILCLPLINRAKLIGILYLENNLTRHVFTPDRVTVLKVLASQAAISLENTRLYRDLVEREAKIRRLVDSNIIGIFAWDFEGQILEANEAFLHMLGYDHEELVAGRIRWTDLTPPDWRDRDSRWIQEHKMTGTLRPVEKEYFRKDGSRVPVMIGAATFEEGGNQGVAFVLDLTERKRAEEAFRESAEALRRSEAYLTQAQTLSHTGTWAFSATSSELAERANTTPSLYYWSEESCRLWGFDPLQGPPDREAVWQRIHPDDHDRVYEAVQHALRQRKSFTVEFRLLLPDGTVKFLEAIGHVSARGELVEVIGTFVDVTERKRAQEEHERLRQLESDLAHMNRLSIMGELAASLAHEMAQPILTARNNARAAVRFLDRSPPDLSEVREALDCIVGDADRAGDIIDRMRDHIKKAPPRRDRFDLNKAINEVIALARSAITKNGVSVRTRLADELFPILGDRVQLQQVVLNLILNAVEAMSSIEAGARELVISTEQSQANGVLVAVSDTGPGIDPEQLERVFEAFYTTKSSGVGMGLSICRSIIDAHGGRLWADVNEPHGAVFQFTLPNAERNS